LDRAAGGMPCSTHSQGRQVAVTCIVQWLNLTALTANHWYATKLQSFSDQHAHQVRSPMRNHCMPWHMLALCAGHSFDASHSTPP
jgi:hypothetical protein